MERFERRAYLHFFEIRSLHLKDGELCINFMIILISTEVMSGRQID